MSMSAVIAEHGALSLVASVAGEDVARRLVAACGGNMVWIPAAPAAGDKLTEALGSIDDALLVARALGSGPVYVPTCLRAEKMERYRRVVAGSARHSPEELARAEGISVSQVYRILAEERRRRRAIRTAQGAQKTA